MIYAPIALFVYRRLSHTKTTVESLLRNKEAAESVLYIFSDAARSEKDSAAVSEVREYIHSITGFQAVHLIEQDKNRGLANSIISGVSSVLEDHDRVIVIEDDLLLSPYFLQYMNIGLSIYQNEERVASIHGYTYPIQMNLPETFFLRGADCWGWATWKRAWLHFEPDAEKLYKEIMYSGQKAEFDYHGYAGNIKMLLKQITGRIDSWAIRWHASAFLANMVTLYPGVSLVQNIGMDGGGTHSDATGAFETKLNLKPTLVQYKTPEVEPAIVAALENYFRLSRPNAFNKLMSRIHKMWR